MARHGLRLPSIDIVEEGPEMEVVSTLVGEDFTCPDLFTEMDVLRVWRDDYVWKEMARWVKYEEAVEEGGERWSKPHVSSLPMEALMELQVLLANCPVLLDLEAYKMSGVADKVIAKWYEKKAFANTVRNHIRTILLKQHHFQYQQKHRENSVKDRLDQLQQMAGKRENDSKSDKPTRQESHLSRDPTDSKNIHFMKKIPHGSKVVNIMIGELDVLDKMIGAFVRLKEATNLGDITEVALETKFIFILIGPPGDLCMCAEIARCLGALFTDEVFRCVAFRSRNREDILAGIKEFSRYLTVLPPGTWDPTTRIEPLDSVPQQDYRKGLHVSQLSGFQVQEDEEEHYEPHCDPTLAKTGRIFGGLLQDVKRKARYYMSDFQDALHIQCVASFFFLFLATLTPNITFGGLLGEKTDNYMGTMECILAAAISGVMFSLFSGQPLNILGSTGPMLVMEEILYNMCKDNGWDYMPFRCWVGIWTAFLILLIVAFDLSALVRYITRFTEESFACLIAIIFIFEAFKKTFGIEKKAPFQSHPGELNPECFCVLNNLTGANRTYPNNYTLPIFYNGTLGGGYEDRNCSAMGGVSSGECEETKFVPDVFFFSLILFFGTYILATVLVRFRNSLFFPMWVRHNVSDFGVLIAIIVWVIVDAQLGLPTPKLDVPTEFQPSKSGRPWIINPMSPKNPWWLILVSIAPALLATILIYMDQQITAVIVNRKENLLKKGSGYHLDMLVLCVLVVVLSIFGLPWYVAATVTALAHIMSLRKESECTAPGEKPMFLGIREQRVTNLLVGVFSGLAVFITGVLRYIPMPVLYGVFLYMGVAPLGNMQLIHRILLIFMPAKYQPDHSYLRHVPIKRVHMFTAIQVVCLVLLWIVKTIKKISIAFPLMVLIICFVRKGIEKIFSQRELKWLDDILPPIEFRCGKSTESLKTKETELSDEESPRTPSPSLTTDLPFSQTKTPTSSPRSSIPYTLPVPPDQRMKKVSQVSRKSLASLMDIDDETRPQPRYSIPFICRTDLSTLKESSTAAIAEKRKSIIMERKLSKQQASDTESDDDMYPKKLSVTSLPNDNDASRLKVAHAYKRIRSISQNDALVEEESAEDVNKRETENKTASDHL